MPPPTQQDQLITPEEAARQLFDLVNSASVAQLLQHQPPAAVSERQQYLLQRCSYALSVVITLVNSATLTAEQVLSVLRHKAAHSAGTLLMWVLQRPQLIDMDQARGTLAEMLYRSSYCLGLLAVAVKKAHSVSSSSNSIGTHAAAMTQQLEQSGVLPGLAVVLQHVIRLTTQQQQQQQDWQLYTRIVCVLHGIPTIWEVSTRACPAMSRTMIPAALQLVQQLQRCGAAGGYRRTSCSQQRQQQQGHW